MKNDEKKTLEIYVHIPFCVKKCAYCDFLSAPAGKEAQDAYMAALLEEIQAVQVSKEREVVSVFVGGGTPTVVDARWIGRIMETLKKKLTVSPDAEITIESNPGTLTRKKLDQYRRAGVNRLSLGLQSADDAELRVLGRIHTFAEFLESYRLAREAGFSNISVDLMFAIPGQTPEGWRRTLCTAAGLGPEHISAYSLIVEEGTPFYEMQLDLPDEDAEYRMYEDTASVLKEYGYAQYEISNYARPGFSCRHNIGYWRRTDYLGIGLGAASLLDDRRFSNTRDMGEYLAQSRRPELLRREVTLLTEKEKMEEFMFLGLRMTEGVREEDFLRQFGKTVDQVYGSVLEKYEKTGFLVRKDGSVCFSRAGIHVSNRILADFLL